MNITQAHEILDRMDRTCDKVQLAYEFADGSTKSIAGTFTPAEARVSIDVMSSVADVARISISRFEV